MSAVTRVADIADQIRGVTYGKQDASRTPRAGYLPVLRAGNISDCGLVFDDLVFVPAARISAKQRIRQNDVVIAASSGSLDVVGKAARALNDFAGGFGAFCKVLRPGPLVDPGYFGHFFQTREYRRRVSALAAGANINNLRNEHLDEMLVPLPPLPEQRRIAAILDQADALRAKRRAAIRKLDELTQAIFLDMFGDPATNPKGWPLVRLGALASKFSDGPFGSNLKSSHYVESGVRVIRLQNIGVGQLIDDDKAFVSESHFSSLKKHECVPGDVLVGTLGDPNLRACVLPPTIPVALNKADCVQIRPNTKVANADFLCALLNQPATERIAHGLMHGQTRVRISMGKLRDLEVPTPLIDLQNDFARRVATVRALCTKLSTAGEEQGQLFASLQHRAFHGEL